MEDFRTPSRLEIVIGEFGFRFFIDTPPSPKIDDTPEILRSIFPKSKTKSLVDVLKEIVGDLVGVPGKNLIFLNSEGFKPSFDSLNEENKETTIYLYFRTKSGEIQDYDLMTYDYFVSRIKSSPPLEEPNEDRILRQESYDLFLKNVIHQRQTNSLLAIKKNKERSDKVYKDFDRFISQFPQVLERYQKSFLFSIPKQLDRYSSQSSFSEKNEQQQEEEEEEEIYYGESFLSPKDIQSFKEEMKKEVETTIKEMKSTFQQQIVSLNFQPKYRNVKNIFPVSLIPYDLMLQYTPEDLIKNDGGDTLRRRIVDKNRVILRQNFRMIEELQSCIHNYKPYKEGFDLIVKTRFEKFDFLSVLLRPAHPYFSRLFQQASQSSSTSNGPPLFVRDGQIMEEEEEDKENYKIGRVYDHLKYSFIIEFVQRRKMYIQKLQESIFTESSTRDQFFHHIHRYFRADPCTIQLYFSSLFRTGLWNWDHKNFFSSVLFGDPSKNTYFISPILESSSSSSSSSSIDNNTRNNKKWNLSYPSEKYFFQLIDRKIFYNKNNEEMNIKIMNFILHPFIEMKKKQSSNSNHEQQQPKQPKNLEKIFKKKVLEIRKENEQNKKQYESALLQQQKLITHLQTKIEKSESEKKKLIEDNEQDKLKSMEKLMTETQVQYEEDKKEFHTKILTQQKEHYEKKIKSTQMSVQKREKSLKTQLAEQHERIRELESVLNNDVEPLRRKLHDSEQKIHELEYTIGRNEKELDVLRKERENTEDLRESILKESGDAQDEKDRVIQRLKNDKKSMKGCIDTISRERNEARVQRDKYRVEAEKYQNGMEFLTRKQKTICEENKKMKAAAEKNQQKIYDFEDRHRKIIQKEEMIEKLENDIQASEELCKQFQEQYTVSEKKVNELRSSVRLLEASNDRMKKRCGDIMSKAQRDVEEISRKYKEEKGKVLFLSGLKEKHVKEIQRLNGSYQKVVKEKNVLFGLSDQVEEKTRVIAELKKVNSTLVQEIRMLKVSLSSGDGNNDNNDRQIITNMLNKKISDLETMVENLRSGNRELYAEKSKFLQNQEMYRMRSEEQNALRLKLEKELKEARTTVETHELQWRLIKRDKPDLYRRLRED